MCHVPIWAERSHSKLHQKPDDSLQFTHKDKNICHFSRHILCSDEIKVSHLSHLNEKVGCLHMGEI